MRTIRFLKKTVVGALSAGATLFIAACYGPPMEPRYQLAHGSVTLPEGTPEGLQVMVCADLAHNESDLCAIVSGGQYDLAVDDLSLDDAQANGYRLCAYDVEDVILKECVDLPPDSGITQQNFDLELAPLD